MLESLHPVASDPILHLSFMYRQDTNPNKVDLGVGVYKDANGHTPIMDAVTKAEAHILQTEDSKAYVGMAGWQDYNQLMANIVFGQDNSQVADNRLAIAQTPGGTGALKTLADFIKRANPSASVWVGKPTWANHHAIFAGAGVPIKEHAYYDGHNHCVDFDAMMDTLSNQAQAGDVVLLHGCCHNPSGADLDASQWQAVGELAQQKGLIPFVDFAYQGMGDGIEEDAVGVRILANMLDEMLVASSCSKNFGIYRERTGTAFIMAKNSNIAQVAQGQLNNVIRSNYSMPPSMGGLIVQTILQDEALKQNWLAELSESRQRINTLRHDLVKALADAGVQQDFNFITQQKGMFSFLGVTAQQVDKLVKEHSVYLVSSSRINVAGLNEQNMAYFAQSVKAVM